MSCDDLIVSPVYSSSAITLTAPTHGSCVMVKMTVVITPMKLQISVQTALHFNSSESVTSNYKKSPTHLIDCIEIFIQFLQHILRT